MERNGRFCERACVVASHEGDRGSAGGADTLLDDEARAANLGNVDAGGVNRTGKRIRDGRQRIDKPEVLQEV